MKVSGSVCYISGCNNPDGIGEGNPFTNRLTVCSSRLRRHANTRVSGRLCSACGSLTERRQSVRGRCLRNQHREGPYRKVAVSRTHLLKSCRWSKAQADFHVQSGTPRLRSLLILQTGSYIGNLSVIASRLSEGSICVS